MVSSLPGLVMFLLVIILPFLVTIGVSFTKWNGVTPEVHRAGQLRDGLGDAAFWTSSRTNILLDAGHVVIPTSWPAPGGTPLQYSLRAFWEPRRNFFPSGVLPAQVMPVAVAESSGLDPCARWRLQLFPAGCRTGRIAHDWLGDPGTALLSIMA